MTEAKTSYDKETNKPIMERGHEWFKNEFEQRIANVPRYPLDDDTASIRFKTDSVNLCPDLFTAAILQIFPNDRYELLIGERDEPGYHWGDHKKILEMYNLYDNILTTYNAFYFEAGGKRYLMVSNLECITLYGNKSYMEKLAVAMHDYEIKSVFSVVDGLYESYLDPSKETTIDVGDYLAAMDAILRDNYISRIAMQFAWTNFEMLRFRMTNELPQCKRPSYKG